MEIDYVHIVTTMTHSKEALGQLGKYVISGGTAVLVHMLLLLGFVELLGLHKVLATTIGFAVGSAVNYTLQYHFVFRSTCPHLHSVFKYVVVTTAMLGLNSLLFWFLITSLALWYMAAQALTISIIFLLNFVVNRSFTFSPGAAPDLGGDPR
jgi:putative flippase GtrA